ncbi:MAG TPA: sulfate adenylyltransferase subunit CysN [Patescibacteria group bacterium]|nr:sulfate adenylyltransferase subunit CysN [Patescibacteria group bacterium]
MKDLLRFSTAGSVDDGKSTLIGRLLLDSRNIFDDQITSVRKASKIDDLDLFLFTDGLKAEREQKITIDVAYRYFSTPKRKFIIADSPGHEQYTRNMATGASHVNLTIILIDARKGLLQQSKRHAFIVSLLRVPHVIVAINKMDLVNYDRIVFDKIKQEFTEFASKLNMQNLQFIPMSALTGENVIECSDSMSWYQGGSLLDILENVHIASDQNLIDLRFPVQYVNRPGMDFRGYSGTVAAGTIKKNDSILVLPSMKKSKVKSIITYDGELGRALASESVTVVLEDEIDISRGDMIVHTHNIPAIKTEFEAMVVWMNEQALDLNKTYIIKHCSKLTKVKIDKVYYKIDVNTLHRQEQNTLNMNEIGRLVLTPNQSLFLDTYQKNRTTGSFILIDIITNNTIAAGMVIDSDTSTNKVNKYGSTLWFTGLSGSGKSTIVEALQTDLGCSCCILDGDILRKGLCSDLGYSIDDRKENIRRVAEVAALLNKMNITVLVSMISPFISDRENAKLIIGKNRFIEIFVDTPIDVCEHRDPKGLYKKVRGGEIKNFTGIDSPYEVPLEPDIKLQTVKYKVEDLINQVKNYLKE